MIYLAIAIIWLVLGFAFSVFVGRTAKFMRDGHYDPVEADDQDQWEYFNPGKSTG